MDNEKQNDCSNGINAVEHPKAKGFETITATELMELEFEPLGFSVHSIMPHALLLCGGAGKIGKSWWAFDACISVSSGTKLWDFDTTQGDVLYLALEDNHRRLQSRLKKMEIENKDISRLHLATASFGISSGLLEQMDSFLLEHPDTKLIVIDTLERVRDTASDKSMYSCDYRDMTALRRITDNHNLTLMLIHHTRKMYDPDPLNTLSGSTGLIGSVDGVFILEKDKRMGNKAKLHIVNRDTESYCFKVEFDSEKCKWLFLGNDDEYHSDDEMLFCALIDDFLKDTWRGTATELCEDLNKIDGSLEVNHLSITKRLNQNKNLLAMKFNIGIIVERKHEGRVITISREPARVKGN